MPKILVVDDSADTLLTVRKILEGEGFEIITAPSGKKALSILQEDIPDLILLDVMMPELDGWETCKKIKEGDKTGGIPVAMLTVKGEDVDKTTSFKEAHADAHITKPFIKEQMVGTINWLLDYFPKERHGKGG